MRRTLSVLILLIPVLLWSACQREAPPREPAATTSSEFRLDEATIEQLQEMMEAGTLTSRELVESYLDRIETIDRSGPMLRSVLQLNPDAVSIAEELDRERAEKGPRGPMHGIPVLLKDNVDTDDELDTTAGSLALLGSKPQRDAFLVRRLREEGAVILGKANLSEWANFRSFHASSGWSARGGQTRNPYALNRNPSGSSAGSAVAVSANLTVVAIGTETDGSVVSPASVCGIVGIKPTVGLVSRSGIIPIAHSQDTAGPMARSVRDAAILLTAMTGIDPDDSETANAPAEPIDYAAGLRADSLEGARIGIVRSEHFGLSARVDPVLESAVAALSRAGATTVDVELPNLEAIGDPEFEVLLYEFKADLAAYLETRTDSNIRTLEDLIAFNNVHRDRELIWFDQELFDMAQEKGPLTDTAYLEALRTARELTRDKGIDAVMREHKLDALVAITNGPSHVTDLVNGDSYSGGSSSPAAVSGYPSVTVPAGWVSGLPIGISFFGSAWSEETLLGFAYSFEQATLVRKPPAFEESAEVSFEAPE